MKKTLTSILLITLMIAIIPSATVYGEDINTETHQIIISKEGDAISVKESLTIGGTSNETYTTIKFWASAEAQEVNVLVSNNEVQYEPTGNNEYIFDISSFNITKDSSIQLIITYTLNKDIEEFEKILIYNTTDLSVEFDENKIYSGENLVSGTSFTLLLYEPTETPVSWYIIVFIVLLVILLVVSTLYSFRKQKSSKIKDIASESEELLNAKKTLLMSLLKDIEKQHRSKQISDDTHHKLKDYYKQQAVETMKRLEDIESEIK